MADMYTDPPKLAHWILTKLLPAAEKDFLCGDFEEIYTSLLEEQGQAAAKRWYRRQCIRSLPRIAFFLLQWRILMLQNFLKVAVRNLNRQKGYAFINNVGLTLGIAVVLVIFLFIQYEQNYDRFHTHSERIYRLNTRIIFGNREAVDAVAAPAVAPVLKAECPEIEKATRFFKAHNPYTIRAGENSFSEKKFFYVDPEFFEVFSFPFIKGDPKTALSQPHSVVLTQTTAKKYFPEEDAVGKTLTINDGQTDIDYLISGVVADVPNNSHFTFDFLAGFADHELSQVNNWFLRACRTYVLLHSEASPTDLEAKFPPLIERGAATTFGGEQNFKNWLAEGNRFEIFLQPIVDIHLHSQGIGAQIEPNGNIAYVTLFSFIGLFILIIAIFNFVNLATARSAKRANEVGVRKVLGSSRSLLIRQFLTESILISLIGFILALGLVILCTPALSILINRKIKTSILLGWPVLPGLVFSMVAIGILAGIYPALRLAAFKPVQVLRGRFDTLHRKRLRSGLVIFQFALSILMIIVTLIVNRQLHYVGTKSLGFDKDKILALPSSPAIINHIDAFMAEINKNTIIQNASLAGYMPGRPLIGEDFSPEGIPAENKIGLNLMAGDENFKETLGLNLIQGRFFSQEFTSDESSLVINETAAKKMNELFGWYSPLNKVITTGRETYTIIGIIADFHFESLHRQIQPMAIVKLPSHMGPFLTFRIDSQRYSVATADLERTWKKFAPEQPFELISFGAETEKLYVSEQRTAKMMSLFSILAVALGCLGLFGLAAFIAEQKTKEIGIRKVFGASEGSLVFMLLKPLSIWVLLANVIAWPLAFYIVQRWLENFAYRTNIAPIVFVASGAIVLVLACLTVAGQALRAAVANPVDALKYE